MSDVFPLQSHLDRIVQDELPASSPVNPLEVVFILSRTAETSAWPLSTNFFETFNAVPPRKHGKAGWSGEDGCKDSHDEPPNISLNVGDRIFLHAEK